MDDRRREDRRKGSVSLPWPEQRAGFDRRRSYPVSAVLRHDDRRFALVLAVILVLGVLDWAFTWHALVALGAYEANPFMRAAFDAGPVQALMLKLVSLTAVIAGLWWLRRYRSAIVLALVTAVLHLALLGYHVVGATLLS